MTQNIGEEKEDGLWSLDVPSAPLSSRHPVEPTVSLTDGRGWLRFAEEALAALDDETSQYAGFDLLQVVCLCADFGLKKVDIRLIPGLLLRMDKGDKKETDLQTKKFETSARRHKDHLTYKSVQKQMKAAQLWLRWLSVVKRPVFVCFIFATNIL